MEISIVNQSHHPLPAYATLGASGMDLRAFIHQPISIMPRQRVSIDTGIAIALPLGYEGQVRPRSGLAFSYGITVLNSPGTVDTDYRGAIKVLLINLSDQPFIVQDGDRIAQLVVAQCAAIVWNEVAVLEATDRGFGRYGSTGIS